MAKNAYVLNDADVAFLRKLRLDYTSSPLGDRAADQYRNRVIVPKDTRTGTVYQEITAGSVSEAGVGSVKFDSLDIRDRSFGVSETDETTVYNYSDTVFSVGDRVLCTLDRTAYQTLTGTSVIEPKNVWVVSDKAGGGDVPSFKVGIGTDALALNQFVTPSTTYTVAWSDSKKVNTDTDVFALASLASPGVYQQIQLKVAGTYRVWYRIEFLADSTHTASEIQRGVCQMNTSSGGAIIEDTASKVESLHIDAVDMGTGLGGYNARSHGETLYVAAAANHAIYVTFSFSSGTRGLRAPIGGFGAQLVKRG